MQRIIPNDAEFYFSILAVLATNPILLEAPVYDPISIIRGEPKRVTIEKFRLFGGLELLEPGLTLSVYPAYSDFNHRNSSINLSPKTKSVEVYTADDRTIERKDIYRVIIQLSYLDPNFDYTMNYRITIKEFLGNELLPYWPQRVYIVDDPLKAEPSQDFFKRPGVNRPLDISISIMPGEEIVKQYVFYVKLALSQIKNILPFLIRAPNLMWVDYPSSAPLRQSGDNLIFHTALLCVEFDMFNQPDARHRRLGY